jgi:hypothetical protein
VLKCFQLADGKQVYAERLNGLSSTWASPIADATGRLYFASAGKSFVIQSGPEFKVLAENDLGDANHASPALAAGRIYLVGEKACVGRTKWCDADSAHISPFHHYLCFASDWPASASWVGFTTAPIRRRKG